MATGLNPIGTLKCDTCGLGWPCHFNESWQGSRTHNGCGGTWVWKPGFSPKETWFVIQRQKLSATSQRPDVEPQ